MVRKVDIAVAFIFGILIAVPLSMQFVGAWTGTQNTLSDGYMEVQNVNATHYYLNDVNYTAWIETLTALGLLQDGSEGLTGNWDAGSVNITADNFTAADFYLESVGNYSAWVESQLASSISYFDLDVLLNKTGGTYYAYYMNGSTASNADFGTLFNNAMNDIDDEGICGIQGGITYNYAVQPKVTGTGSGYAKHIEVVGVGGGPYPILSPTADNIHGLEVEKGANLHLHKINFAMKTSGTSGSAIYGANQGGNAYLENSLFLSRIGDIKITGGTAEVDLIYLEDSEWVEFYGLIYINGASETNGFHSKITSAAQYHYGSNLISGQMFISITGGDNYGMFLEGYDGTLSHMNFVVSGRLWIVNDGVGAGNHEKAIGLKMYRCTGCYIGGLMTERCGIALEMNSSVGNTISATGLYQLPRAFGLNDEWNGTKAFFDINSGCYANWLTDITVLWTNATYMLEVVDDDQADANAPNTLDNWTLHLTGGEFTATFAATTFEQDYGGGRWYKQLGSGTYP